MPSPRTLGHALPLVLLAACSNEKALHRAEAGPVSCRLLAVADKTLDVTCESTTATQITSVKHIMWAGGGSADSEILSAPRPVGPGVPFRMTVLRPTSGELELSERGDCSHGFQLSISGVPAGLSFPKVRTRCRA